jgi:hypothetical protein
MPRREADSSYQSQWRRRFLVLATVLFPLLVLGGALAPQVVIVMIDESELPAPEEELESPELNFRRDMPGMPPLPFPLEPLDFGTSFIPELLDLQHLFTRSRRSKGPMSLRFSRLLNFPRRHGDLIVMDDVDRQIGDVLFDDPILVGAVTDDIGQPDPSLLSLDGPRPLGDGLTFDGPQGSSLLPLVSLPEPSSFGLTLAGLVVLARRGHRPEPGR